MKSFIQCCFISGCPDKEVKVISTPMSYNVPLENSCNISIKVCTLYNKSYAKNSCVWTLQYNKYNVVNL